MVESDEDHDLELDNQDETDEEQVRRVSQTTGVLAHGVGTTGVQGSLGADPTTILLLPQNADTEEDINDSEEDGLPGKMKKMTFTTTMLTQLYLHRGNMRKNKMGSTTPQE
jgi:hypothetical protein